MHMRYSEVVSFLERRARDIQQSPIPELVLENTKIPQIASPNSGGSSVYLSVPEHYRKGIFYRMRNLERDTE